MTFSPPSVSPWLGFHMTHVSMSHHFFGALPVSFSTRGDSPITSYTNPKNWNKLLKYLNTKKRFKKQWFHNNLFRNFIFQMKICEILLFFRIFKIGGVGRACVGVNHFFVWWVLGESVFASWKLWEKDRSDPVPDFCARPIPIPWTSASGNLRRPRKILNLRNEPRIENHHLSNSSRDGFFLTPTLSDWTR